MSLPMINEVHDGASNCIMLLVVKITMKTYTKMQTIVNQRAAGGGKNGPFDRI